MDFQQSFEPEPNPGTPDLGRLNDERLVRQKSRLRDHTVLQVNLDAKNLKIDRRYQRPIMASRVDSMARYWSKSLAGSLEISRRADADYVVDGQQRVTAGLQVDPAICFPCNLHLSLSFNEECILFEEVNRNRKAVAANSDFRSRLARGEPVAKDIEWLTELTGYKLVLEGTTTTLPMQVAAVGSLETIYRTYGKAELYQVLNIIRECWPNEVRATRQGVLDGLSLFVHLYGKEMDYERLIRVLSNHTTQDLTVASSALARATGGTIKKNIARQIFFHYNERLRTNRLTDHFSAGRSDDG